MKIRILLFCLLPLTVFAADEGDIEVLILGTYHMDNPGMDVLNIKADDVRSPRRQKELEALTSSLIKFKPSKIAVERRFPNKGLKDSADLRFQKVMKKEIPMESDEIDQIAYRMAIKLGHTRVYGVDASGQFPFDKLSEFAKKHGSFKIIEDSIKEGQAIIEEENRLLAESTLTQYFRNMNDWKLMEEEFGFYMRLLHINHDEDYPGAGLVADWHERNLKILANIMRISEKGDRVFVLIGAGHAYLLRQYIAVTPGLKLVDPLDYL